MIRVRSFVVLMLAVGAILPIPSHAGTLKVALTVDDLPAHGSMPDGMTRADVIRRIVETLQKHGLSTVYGFLNGAELHSRQEFGAAMLAWQRAGLPVANHTFSHLDLGRVSATDFIADIARNEADIERFGSGARYFRYPYLQEGDTREKRNAVREWLFTHGYTVAPVTVALDDWAWNEAYVRCLLRSNTTAAGVLRRSFVRSALSRLVAVDGLARRLYARSIRHLLVLHASAFTAATLDDVLSAYRAGGVTLVPLDAAVTDPVYATDPGVVGDGRRTFLAQIADRRGVEIPPEVSAPPPDEMLARCR